MAYHFNDNINTKSFTPREYQVELLDAAKERNIIVCLATGPGKIFIATKLIQELSNSTRRSYDNGGKRTLYLVDSTSMVALQASYVRHLTDLNVGEYCSMETVDSMCFEEWKKELIENHVLVMTSQICLHLFEKNVLNIANLNLIVLDDCHRATKVHPIRQIMKYYKSSHNLPRLLGLTAPLLNTTCDPAHLEAEIRKLEYSLHSIAETASDVVSILRYCNKPKEFVLECGPPELGELDEVLEREILSAKEFIADHRYDPADVYDEEYLDELKDVPDPKIDPEQILNQFLDVLHTLGPYCADRAAFVLLMYLEKLKVKTPYERHFLLLCMVSSVLIKIRAICDHAFQCYDEKEKILKFTSPKILRLLEILRQFKPVKSPDTEVKECAVKSMESSEECAKTALGCEVEGVCSELSEGETDHIAAVENCIVPIKAVINSESNDDLLKSNDSQILKVEVDTNCEPNDNGLKDETKRVDLPKIENGTINSLLHLEIKSVAANQITPQNVVKLEEVKQIPSFFPRQRFSKYRRGLNNNSGNSVGNGGKPELGQRLQRNFLNEDVNALCGIIFVEEKFTAKILFQVLNELRRNDEDLTFLSPQYTVGKTANPITDCREAEVEHRKQEEVLKRFRMRDCNLLIGTSVLEEGIDVPKCNLVVRFDIPTAYRSYVLSKGRAKAQDAYFILMIERSRTTTFVKELAQYMEIEQLLLRKCANREPSEEEENEADEYTEAIKAYRPVNSPSNASVNLLNAVTLVNRYCAKLPSDTFTRLTPLWTMNSFTISGEQVFTCTIRLPINSPVKQDIVGLPMRTRVLARRMAALQTCQTLHKAKELDDNLLPVGKESFRLHEEEETTLALEEIEEMVPRDSNEPRPGTTKRRQYYYKRIAPSLTECRPVPKRPAYLYFINMVLTCPLPEEQNTRGRKIYPPEESPQGFGILTLGEIPKICPFPIFTRSGEVSVSLELSRSEINLTEEKVEKIVTFLNYTFTSVLRLQKYLMMFDPQASENSYFIVPTKKQKGCYAEVDWEFLDRIYEDRDLRPHPIPEKERQGFVFDAPRYHDAVIMPWYRNQDQPQYFYVAEICGHLSPKSSFPGAEYKTFDEYYWKKYSIQIQNCKQPLLDVDHTSARLNFLTPRYVNRKGVALPTSSEETKRAKRENLEQKQILVPELCTVHPFPASLWRKAVCLPCILYRINALLLADQVRMKVANSIALGRVDLDQDFEWKPLDFGWSLADVLLKSKENNKNDLNRDKKESKKVTEMGEEIGDETHNSEGPASKMLTSEEKKFEGDWMEIGTWSNEMAAEAGLDFPEMDYFDPSMALSSNLTFLVEDEELMGINSYNQQSDWGRPRRRERFRYGSPSSWLGGGGFGLGGIEQDLEGFETDDSSEPDYYDKSEDSDGEGTTGLRIQFKGNNEAEAVEDEIETEKRERRLMICDIPAEDNSKWDFSDDLNVDQDTVQYISKFHNSTEINRRAIETNGSLIRFDQPIQITRNPKKNFFIELMAQVANETVIDDGRPSVTVEGITFCTDKLMPILDRVTLQDNCDTNNTIVDQVSDWEEEEDTAGKFSFDVQPELVNNPGPSPSLILQALTMSNANDGINLERLETIGDSFLKYAITTYLYCTYENIHEGKLSHLRSKQVSNLNLYRLGRRKVFGESMIATKFEPHDNWLPPCYYVPRELEQALIEAGIPASHWNQADLPALRDMTREEICRLVRERSEKLLINDPDTKSTEVPITLNIENLPCFIPYNLITQHSIPDKSIADCVEALIGAYLIACGPRGALIFMAWLGICVLPKEEIVLDGSPVERPVGSVIIKDEKSERMVCYGQLKPPRSPLLRNIALPEVELNRLLDGYDAFERKIGYRFRDRSYLLQSLTHASYSPNRLTDCYQRLEFLGDAVLDYLITRHLYEDSRQHSPGALTDLRSALVNNTIFASLAVRFGFHKYFRHLSPGLNDVVDRFVRIQEENGHTISEEYYLIEEEECEEAEDVEVPKALGDVFESVAGAIFLDSGMSLDAVWRVYYRMMRTEIEQFSTNVPKSPIRDLLELEPETAKFGKPEKLADGRRVRVTVEVFGKGVFKGIGRNYRIAKCTAAKCALKSLKKKSFLAKKT